MHPDLDALRRQGRQCPVVRVAGDQAQVPVIERESVRDRIHREVEALVRILEVAVLGLERAQKPRHHPGGPGHEQRQQGAGGHRARFDDVDHGLFDLVDIRVEPLRAFAHVLQTGFEIRFERQVLRSEAFLFPGDPVHVRHHLSHAIRGEDVGHAQVHDRPHADPAEHSRLGMAQVLRAPEGLALRDGDVRSDDIELVGAGEVVVRDDVQRRLQLRQLKEVPVTVVVDELKVVVSQKCDGDPDAVRGQEKRQQKAVLCHGSLPGRTPTPDATLLSRRNELVNRRRGSSREFCVNCRGSGGDARRADQVSTPSARSCARSSLL